jgi:hypothetical protein
MFASWANCGGAPAAAPSPWVCGRAAVRGGLKLPKARLGMWFGSQGAALQHTRRMGPGPQDRLGPSPPRRDSPAHERETDAAVGGSVIGRELPGGQSVSNPAGSALSASHTCKATGATHAASSAACGAWVHRAGNEREGIHPSTDRVSRPALQRPVQVLRERKPAEICGSAEVQGLERCGRPHEFLARRGAGPGAPYEGDIGNASIGCAPEWKC